MGRFPPVKQYPEPHVWERWLQERPELGRGGWERREFAKRHRASVVNPDGRGWQQWVTRYELHARTEGGKAWTVIGTFEGNSDMTSEVAHDLREACRSPDGLRCRFLRFLPQGLGPLRITGVPPCASAFTAYPSGRARWPRARGRRSRQRGSATSSPSP
ncbi:unnamed protein product [Prorocentrum cordatum]|uniref:Uncharacterized protein n=1 Tax=Prorocentrum cordatum TaxID=2364126 RepID=A0ABN9R8X4_9DINO|nr:unnamed protein product [Polarella glacialis]